MRLVINDLCKAYRKSNMNIVNHLSFNINEKEVFALVGQNGVGKTTTIKCILKFLKFNSGNISIEGEETIETLMDKSSIGYLPEALTFPGMVTLKEFLYDLCILRSMDKRQSKDSIVKLTREFGLEDYLNKNISKFSKGMKKKVGFIQAVINKPKLVILDEPTDGLDPISRRQVLMYIRKMADDGAMVLISSHILSDLEIISDRVALMSKGKIVSEIRPNNIKSVDDKKITIELRNEADKIKRIDLSLNSEIEVLEKSKLKVCSIDDNESKVDLESWYYDVHFQEVKASCGK